MGSFMGSSGSNLRMPGFLLATRPWWGAIFVATFVLCMLPLFFSSATSKFVYDEPYHIQVMSMVLQNGRLPSPHECWECYQPPLYYALGAGLFSWIGDSNPELILHGLSFLLFLVFQIFGVKTFLLARWPAAIEFFAIAVFCLWPAGVVHVFRIGNDAPLFAFWGATLFFFLRSGSDQAKPNDCRWGTLFAVLAVLTKGNAIILVIGCTVALILPDLGPVSRPWKQKRIWLGGLAICMTIWLALLLRNQRGWPVANNVELIRDNPAILTTPTLHHLLGFDLFAYFREAYTHAWVDRGGRQFVLNFMLKTSLFGEFSTDSTGHATLLLALAAILLLWLASILWALFDLFRTRNETIRFNCIFVALCVAGIWANRIIIPAAPSADFRYVYPVLIPATMLVAERMKSLKTGRLRDRLSISFAALSTIFALLSVASWYFLTTG